MEMYGYDIEDFKNYALFVFVDMADYFRLRNAEGVEDMSAEQFEAHIKTAKRHVFHIGFKLNDIAKLVAFVNRDIVLCSFNGNDYDNVLINACIANINRWKSIEYTLSELYKLSQRVIANQNAKIFNDDVVNVYKYMRTFYRSVDVQKVFALNKALKSLKQTLINVKWYNIEDYEMPPLTAEEIVLYTKREVELIEQGYIKHWERFVIPTHLPNIFNYCLNDTLGVCEIVYQYKDEITLRFDISKKFGVNVLSSSRSNIADILFGKFYCEAADITVDVYRKGRTYRKFIDIGQCIPPFIKFRSNEFNELLTKLRTTRIYNTKGEIEFPVEFKGTKYIIATGGLHSEDTPGKFDNTGDFEIKDADVTSYYPMIVHNNRISPDHLDTDIFLTTTYGIIVTRIKAKDEGDKVTADTFKIVINVGVFGKMGFEDSPAYDPKAMVQVTIAGQLSLLMLVEDLEYAGFNVISANTDGIVTLVDKTKVKEYHKVCDDWQNKVKLKLEFTNYEKYIRMNVNHYMAVKVAKHPDDPVRKRTKFKGQLNPYLHKEELTKGFNKPIVAHAVYNYFIEEIPVMDTLREHRDILDFCATQKPGSKFKLELHTVKNGKAVVLPISKTLRYYVSRNQTRLLSGLVLKNDTTIPEGSPRKRTNVVSGKNITIFNKKVTFDNFEDYNIDYGYYHAEANKIINAIQVGSKAKKTIKKEYGQYKMGI
jgi:hypothetical protein